MIRSTRYYHRFHCIGSRDLVRFAPNESLREAVCLHECRVPYGIGPPSTQYQYSLLPAGPVVDFAGRGASGKAAPGFRDLNWCDGARRYGRTWCKRGQRLGVRALAYVTAPAAKSIRRF
jgi:hypothetical protein